MTPSSVTKYRAFQMTFPLPEYDHLVHFESNNVLHEECILQTAPMLIEPIYHVIREMRFRQHFFKSNFQIQPSCSNELHPLSRSLCGILKFSTMLINLALQHICVNARESNKQSSLDMSFTIWKTKCPSNLLKGSLLDCTIFTLFGYTGYFIVGLYCTKHRTTSTWINLLMFIVE